VTLSMVRVRSRVRVLAPAVLALALVAEPAAQAGAKPEAQAAADPFRFTSDAAVMIWAIKPDQTEAFESVWNVIRSRLKGSAKPELKSLGESLTIFKADTPGNPGEATYFLVANPASKTTSYELSPFLLFGSGLFERPEADELFKLISGTIIRINPFPVNAVRE
jgi:hypothetical protein